MGKIQERTLCAGRGNPLFQHSRFYNAGGADCDKKAYDSLSEIYAGNNIPLPKNKPVAKTDIDLKNRKLDCLVMNHLQMTSPFDAFIAPFWEGNAIYEGAMFRESTHIQIAVKNPKSILGYFIPKELKLK